MGQLAYVVAAAVALVATAVKPAHPAPYLKYRARSLVNLMNRVATRRHFTTRYFAVLGPSRQRVL
jgi:hypothetical protein